MKAISFSDIKRASWLQGFSEVDMLSIENDEKVNRVLDALGVDCEYGISYYAAQHRNLAGDVLVGYLAAGEIQINRNHLTSPFADLTDILAASAYTDLSLTFELGELSGKQHCYESLLSLDDDTEKGFPKELVEPSCEQIGEQIRSMNELCESIRGASHNSAGAVKTPEEYQAFAAERNTNNKGNK